MQLLIESMTCGGCARGVTAIIHELDPNAQVNIDVPNKIVTIDNTTCIEQILLALAEDGFAAQVQSS
ncbi:MULTISPECIES: heavy-metal-associated domain-containing protein [unclassified Acinetobacter]|uniref:heavy-metal-associated domain-containing protein n=1 Tax=unclassified Acinetobacter TaxID=196816 RepID=UPI002934CA49|nr:MULTISPECIES: heavy-metal-associated domain-containing protein [unclassified Acinetobacter]WOE32385.1 heavy-metal-associated domain-containing protein [Acinetobacter sp. SAAs470]WOE37858.1 heavy-metal-associated domain-containing protein [Acinetobacter sp. SAAs474]